MGDQVLADARFVASLLRSMGVRSYEPRVVTQLLELMHRFTAKVATDAKDLAEFAEKPQIDEDDLALAVKEHIERNHAAPPTQSALRALADARNAQPLPPLPDHVFGVHLPEGGSGHLAVSNFEREISSARGAGGGGSGSGGGGGGGRGARAGDGSGGAPDGWAQKAGGARGASSSSAAAMVDGKVAVMDLQGASKGGGGGHKRKASALDAAAEFTE